MQSCYSSPQQLQAAAAAALSFHQHQQRLAASASSGSFPAAALMHGPGPASALTPRQHDDVDDDVTGDDVTHSRLAAAERMV